MQTNVHVLPDGRIKRKEAARYIGVKDQTMAAWDHYGTHGSFFKKQTIAGRVYYDFEQVKKFCERNNDIAA